MKHTTPMGIVWVAYGPTAPNVLGVDNPPDGLQYQDVATISDAIDTSVQAVALQYPGVAVWPIALGLNWAIVDDYAMPDCGAVDGTTGYASGMTTTIGNTAVAVTFCLWSRHNLPVGAPEPDLTTLLAPWTIEGPAVNNVGYWRYGDIPILPAIGYELRVNVLRVSNN